MKKDTWSYIINTFLVATNNNFHLAVKIAKEHDATLEAGNKDPDIMIMYTAFHPIYLALEHSYNVWKAQKGTQHGKTVSLETIVAELTSQKISDWDIAIQAVYKKDTGNYAALLPHHRIPFQSKGVNDRITAVSSLLTNLEGIVPLAAVKADVSAFSTVINAALDVQKSAIKTTKIQNTAVEAARVTMCEEMFGNYGTFITLNKKNPGVVADLFPLKYFRRTNQIYFTRSTKPGKYVNIAKHKMGATSLIQVTTHSDAPVRIFISETKTDKSLTKGVVVPGNTISDLEGSLLGDTSKCSYLIIVNTSTNITADWSVEFM